MGLQHDVSKDPAGAAAPAGQPDLEPAAPKKLPSRVSISDILERRARAGKLVAGTAAYSDSDMFKGPVWKHTVPFVFIKRYLWI